MNGLNFHVSKKNEKTHSIWWMFINLIISKKAAIWFVIKTLFILHSLNRQLINFFANKIIGIKNKTTY